MDMSACDRLAQVVEKHHGPRELKFSQHLFLTHFSALSQMSGEKGQGVQQVGKKGDKIYVLSQRVHEHSCRAERGSGRDARTRRMVIG